jgi:diadenosine tetraphosphate (Ap4A) HIT family hydrolase
MRPRRQPQKLRRLQISRAFPNACGNKNPPRMGRGTMANLIEERVMLARAGQNPYVIARMASGWCVIGDVQPLAGYCLLLADPVVESANALGEDARVRYSLDMLRIGDALLDVTDAYRINYETLGNSEPALHTHIIPRFMSEPEEKRRMPAFMSYDWATGRRFDLTIDAPFMDRMRLALKG